MADSPFVDIVPGITTGLVASQSLNNLGSDGSLAIRSVSEVAEAGNELSYYVTGTSIYSIAENKYYRYNGLTWVEDPELITSNTTGLLADLDTTEKGSLVGAINEIEDFFIGGGTVNGPVGIADGKLTVTSNLVSNSGAQANILSTMYAYDGIGSQWASMFARAYTATGQSSVGQLNGLLTALYHTEGFTLSEWQGIETGAVYVSGAGSEITESYGIATSLPVVTDGAAVGTAAGVRIKPMATTGITNVYAILSELVATSLFKGAIEVDGVSVPLDMYRDGGPVTVRNTAYQNSEISGGTFTSRFARGTQATPLDVQNNDLLSQFTAQAYIDGGFRTVGALQFYADATPGVGSYPSKFYLRLIDDASTTLTVRALLEGNGDFTLGTSSKVGNGVLYSGRVALGKNAALSMLDIYADSADTVGIIVNSRETPTQPLAQFKQNSTTKLTIGIEGILEFTGTMGNSSKNPTVDAPADWLQIEIGGTTYYVPAYVA